MSIELLILVCYDMCILCLWLFSFWFNRFPQASTNDSCSEDDEDVAIDHSKSVEIEGRDLLEAVIKEKVSDAQKEDLEPDDANMDEPDACGKQEGNANACSQKVC